MITLHFPKLYNNIRKNEPCSVCIPFKKGKVTDKNSLQILDDNKQAIPSQCLITSTWEDNSIRYALIRFAANLPANKATDYYLDICDKNVSFPSIAEEKDNTIFVDTNTLKLQINKSSGQLFDLISFNKRYITPKDLAGPILVDKYGRTYENTIENVELLETGPVTAVVSIKGNHSYNGEKFYDFSVLLTLFVDNSFMDISYKITNTTTQQLQIQSLSFKYLPSDAPDDSKTAIGISNYGTKLQTSTALDKLEYEITPDSILYEAIEHYPEVFAGTFFADYTDERSGLCTTIYQAKQNFPKAFRLDKTGMNVYLVPQCPTKVILQPGMARTQKLLLHFHTPDITPAELDSISTVYQMPDIVRLDPDVYKEAEVFDNIFINTLNSNIEIYLENSADKHGRAFGITNWGDFPDVHYTAQGRGNGQLIWCNNEYDFPHACMMMYARTGERRFLDYMLVSARHQIDIDICHYNDNPLLSEGQWMHSANHCTNSEIICSHQWIEGLLDYYHITGHKDAFEAAVGIGNNILRLLETDKFSTPGQTSARETGWALRTLTALYNETHNSKWIEKCDWIVSHFEEWKKEYGVWLSPYTNNTSIRVPFMISVAVGSLMRYYRIKPNENIKNMIIDAVNDLLENARLSNGLFYYKELPSLNRNGNNPLILEALAIAYELTGDAKYLEAGIPTLKYILSTVPTVLSQGKEHIEDSVLFAGTSPKSFAQNFLPIAKFYNYASELELTNNI